MGSIHPSFQSHTTSAATADLVQTDGDMVASPRLWPLWPLPNIYSRSNTNVRDTGGKVVSFPRTPWGSNCQPALPQKPQTPQCTSEVILLPLSHLELVKSAIHTCAIKPHMNTVYTHTDNIKYVYINIGMRWDIWYHVYISTYKCYWGNPMKYI